MVQRTCLIPECANPSRARGWCQKHYDAWYKHGDPLHKRVLKRDQTCHAPDCQRKIHARQWCSMHYGRWLATRSIELPEIRPVAKISKDPKGQRLCGIEGCGRKHDARGLCVGHYRRWKLYGDPMSDVPLGEVTKKPRFCEVLGCGRKHRSKGLCGMHYNRMRANGTLESQPYRKTFEEKMRWNTKEESSCVIWIGVRNVQGYGQTNANGRGISAHRYVWEHHNGKIPEGLEIDHICHNVSCVNIEHLRVVTRQQNAQYRQGAMPGNRSGIRGVTYHPGSGKWRARVSHNKKMYNLGLFEDRYEAGKVAALMRQELGFPLSDHDRQLIDGTFRLAA